MITGCPGVRKSLEVFSYAMGQAHLHKKRVLNGFSILYKDDSITLTSRICGIQKFDSEPVALVQFIASVLCDGAVDLIVLNGFFFGSSVREI